MTTWKINVAFALIGALIGAIGFVWASPLLMLFSGIMFWALVVTMVERLKA